MVVTPSLIVFISLKFQFVDMQLLLCFFFTHSPALTSTRTKILPTPLVESYPRVYLQAAKEKESEPSEPGRRALLSLKSKENGENNRTFFYKSGERIRLLCT